MNQNHIADSLPTFIALDSYSVLDGHRRGTSVQLDETYFTGQLQALEGFDGGSEDAPNTGLEDRTRTLRNSLGTYRSIDVTVDSFTEDSLWTASTQFRQSLQALPEIDYLKRQFPGRCFVVPEWLKSGSRLHYGARVYLLRDDDSTEPEDIIQHNIDALLDGSFHTFERYQGELHGYPDCCIEFYQARASNAPSPERRSIEPFADRIADDAIGHGPAVAIDDLLVEFTEWDGRYAFFAREFFPEPGCETAREQGRAIYDGLSSGMSTRLVEDYFGLTFAYNYLVARAVQAGESRRPAPGKLGREHLMFYLPLRAVSAAPRYT